jgi:isochorismate pyruvate lyase
MKSHTEPRHLDILRSELDDLDRQVVMLLAKRAEVIQEVIDFKRSNSVGAVDKRREDEMLTRIEAIASEANLDPRIARQVLRSVIDSFVMMEQAELP